jgi:ABC-2 type transport system permease protein
VKALGKFVVEYKASWHLTLEYRIAVFIWMFAMVLPLVMLAAWLSIAEGGPVGRFGREQFIAYYVAALLVRNLTGTWIIWEQDRDIRQGQLSFKLLKPMNPVIHYIALALGSKPIRCGMLIPFVIAVPYLFPGVEFASAPFLLVSFVVAVVGAWAIGFLIQYTMGLLGFWISQATNLHDVWFAVFSLCSGYLIPLDLFPPALRNVLYASPFRYMLSFPVEIFTKQLGPMQILPGLAMQWIWAGVFFALYRFVWARGLKQYSAVGS